MVLDNTCSNKPTEIWVSKRDLTNDEELPGATLAIKDMDGNTVTTWVSTDEPHRVTRLHFGESYTLTEIRAADGYALADNITFRLIQKSDEGRQSSGGVRSLLSDQQEHFVLEVG